MTLPELRALPWSRVVGPIVVGAALIALTSAGLMDGPAPPFVWLGLGSLVLGVGCCLDDPSAMVTAACPATRRRRTVERMIVPLVVATWWCLFAVLVDGVNGLSGTSVALTGTGAILATLATADWLRRLGVDQPGSVIGSVTLLGLVGCLLFQPFGDVVVLQAYEDRGSAGYLWVAASLVACLSLLWSTSDPARP